MSSRRVFLNRLALAVPAAGLSQAREWVKSDDPHLVRDAAAVLEDIGGHEQELSAAKTTLERVEQQASPGDRL